MIRVKKTQLKWIRAALFTALLAVIVVWYRAVRHGEAVACLEAQGVSVIEYHSEIHSIFNGYEVLVSHMDDAGFDKVMPCILKLNRLKAMEIQKASITKKSLMKLVELSQLRRLTLVNAGDFTLDDVMTLKKLAPELAIGYEFKWYY